MNKRNYKHGFYGTKLYRAWDAMKQRCLNVKHKFYKDYGGRGIKVCTEWLDKDTGFAKFRDWSLSNGYTDNLEIDRINNGGNYEPSNCRWTTHTNNNRNRRNVKLSLEIANEIRALYKTGNYTQEKLAEKYNTNHGDVSSIINNKRWKNI